MAAFGIYVGNTCCCLAVFKDDRVEVVANDAGDRVTPAIVAYHHSDVVVGSAAKQEMARHHERTLTCVKQNLGLVDMSKESDVASSSKLLLKDGEVKYEIKINDDTRYVSPSQVLTEIYSAILDIAENHGAKDVHDAVITVPKWFSEHQKSQMREAAERAGFNVLRVISETSAALLAYNIGQEQVNERIKVIVFRCGGYSSDATLVEVVSGMYTVVDQVYYQHAVSGNHATHILHDYLIDEFNRKWKCDVRESRRAVTKLKQVAEQAKNILSSLHTANCYLESLYEGIDLDTKITRARFNSLISSHVRECLLPVSELLERSNTSAEEITSLVLVGGGCRLPLLRDTLLTMFPDAQHHTHVPPDECIAIGAAHQAGLLTDADDESRPEDGGDVHTSVMATPNPISLKLSVSHECGGGEGEQVEILPKHCAVPTRRQHLTALTSLLSSSSPHLQHHVDVSVEVIEIVPPQQHVILAKMILQGISVASMVTTTVYRKSDSLEVVSGEQASSNKQRLLIPSAAS